MIPKCATCHCPVVSYDQCKDCSEWFCNCGHKCKADPFEECLCGHIREDHSGGCQRDASSGYRCSCPSFEAVTT